MTVMTQPERASGSRSLLKAALAGAALAAAVNAFIYAVCYAVGIIPWSMLSPGKDVQITPQLVMAVSIGGPIAGAMIYAIMRRTMHDPVRTFRWTALVVLMLSFGAPMAMNMFSTALEVSLSIMHIVVAVATVWALTVWAEGSK